MDEHPIAAVIDGLFRDAYRILEEIQGQAEYVDPFSDSIVSCHWSIQNLERIHKTQSRTPHSTLAQDAFSLRDNLERFIASCHALVRFVNPHNFEIEAGCMFGGKSTLKRKQVVEMQEEFWDLQRMLSMLLANAI